jgi:hypothetical protein
MAKKILTVVIDVSGGLATIAEKPKGVKLIIRDYDSKAMSGKGDNSWKEVYGEDKDIISGIGDRVR